MGTSATKAICRSIIAILATALAVVVALTSTPQAQAEGLIAAQSDGATSQYALLKADGYLVPCSSTGAELSSVWIGSSDASVVNNVHTVFVDSEIRTIGETYQITYAEDHFGNNYTANFSSKTASVNSWWSNDQHPGLPKLSTAIFLSGSKCSAISSNAFKDASNLSSISLPNTIVSIGDEAFGGCTSLYEVDFGSSLRSIGTGSFKNCTSLTEIDLPVTFATLDSSYSDGSFNGAGLTKVTLRAVTPISDGAGGKEIWRAFKNTPIVQTGAAYIYVPTSALTAYRTYYGTNGKDGEGWSYFNQDHLDKLRGLDGEPTSISGASVSVSPTSFTYDGAAKKPSVTVTLGSSNLVQGRDYKVTYSNNVNAGTATVTVTGIGLYAGTRSANFTITRPANESKGNSSGNSSGNSGSASKDGSKVSTGKKANTLEVSPKTAKVSKSKKAKTLAVSKVLKVSKAQGTVTYKKLSGNKKITVNGKTGKVKVKGGLKKKTYKVKVRVTAAGNENYDGGHKEATFRVKVK